MSPNEHEQAQSKANWAQPGPAQTTTQPSRQEQRQQQWWNGGIQRESKGKKEARMICLQQEDEASI